MNPILHPAKCLNPVKETVGKMKLTTCLPLIWIIEGMCDLDIRRTRGIRIARSKI